MHKRFLWGGQPGSQGKFSVCVCEGGGGVHASPPPPIEAPLIVMNNECEFDLKRHECWRLNYIHPHHIATSTPLSQGW